MTHEFLLLVYEFFKTGLFAVGGGLATVPFLKRMAETYYEKYGWFSVRELTDMIAVSESTPGPIGVNMATYAGFRAGFPHGGVPTGFLGGVLATLALVAPSVIVILIVSRFLQKFKTNALVEGAFYGIRPCSTSLIAAAMLDVLLLSCFEFGAGAHSFLNLTFPTAARLPSLAFYFLLIPFAARFQKVHPAVFIAVGALAGILLKL